MHSEIARDFYVEAICTTKDRANAEVRRIENEYHSAWGGHAQTRRKEHLDPNGMLQVAVVRRNRTLKVELGVREKEMLQ